MSDLHPHRYGLHGVTIRTNHPFEGMLPPIPGAAEVTIDFAGVGVPQASPHPPLTVIGFERLWHLDDATWLLRYDAAIGAWSVLIDANRMTVCWTEGIAFSDIPPALHGAAIGAMLLLRGIPLLHASAIDLGGQAILILGDPGAGKSTTAAAFIRRGYRLLADDTAALEIGGDRVFVHPGLPRLRLDPDSASALGWTAADLTPVFTCEFNDRKRYIDGGGRSTDAVPVRTIYLLRKREPDRVEPLIRTIPQRVALGELLKNAYGAPYLDSLRVAWLFESFSRIADRVPVREIRTADSLALLPRLVDALVADA